MNQKQHENLDTNKFLKTKQNLNLDNNVTPLLFEVTTSVPSTSSPQLQKSIPTKRTSLQANCEVKRPLLSSETDRSDICNEISKSSIKKTTTEASLYSKDSKYNSQSLIYLSICKKLSNGSLGTN